MKTRWSIFLLGMIFISLAGAQDIYDDCSIYGTCKDTPGNITIININQSVNVTEVNSTDFWNTDQGALKNINSTMFEEIGQRLTAKISYWDTFYCLLTGCTMTGNITAPFIFAKINASNVTNAPWLENATDLEEIGFNLTDNLTSFYDQRYLTSSLALFFYNNSDSFNSTYTIMNTTVPSGGDSQIDRFTSLPIGQNLLTPRILTEINITLLQSGGYDQHTTIDFISGTKDVQLLSEMYKKLANQTEVLIGQSPVSQVLANGVYQQVEWTGTINNDTIFDEGDRLVMRLYAVVSGLGSNPTIDLVVADNTAARLDIGVNPIDLKINEVDPFFSDNFTLFNDTWTSTFNQSYEDAFQFVTNGTFLEEELDPLAYNGTLFFSADWNATNESYYLETNPFGFFNSTNPQTETDPLAYNGSLFLSADWNATNESYMLASDWNATNESYRLENNHTFNGDINYQDGTSTMTLTTEILASVFPFPFFNCQNSIGTFECGINKSLNIINLAGGTASLQFGNVALSSVFGFDFNPTTGTMTFDSTNDADLIINEKTNFTDGINITGGLLSDTLEATGEVKGATLNIGSQAIQLDGGTTFDLLYHDGTDWVKKGVGGQDTQLTSCPTSSSPMLSWHDTIGGQICPI